MVDDTNLRPCCRAMLYSAFDIAHDGSMLPGVVAEEADSELEGLELALATATAGTVSGRRLDLRIRGPLACLSKTGTGAGARDIHESREDIYT